VEYFGKWITDLEITAESAKTILDAARARWKIENECFNSLKNHGYNIEHNYGHGKENASYYFYNFTLLTFTIHQLTDILFTKLRSSYGRLTSLWNDIRAFVNRLFNELEELWLFLLGDRNSNALPA
jgi:hypothetical protein